MVENGKAPKGEPSPESGNVKGEQGAHQTGGSNVGSVTTEYDAPRTELGIGSRIDLEPVSLHTEERLGSVFVDSIISRP